MGKKSDKKSGPPGKAIASYKKARFLYEIEETLEAGIVLKGSEVKALREGKGSFTDAYARVENGEMWMGGFNISRYSNASYASHDPDRKKKLLMHRREIDKLGGRVAAGGYTLVPLRVYWKEAHVKVLLGLGRGKKLHDKRHAIRERDEKRSQERDWKRG